MVSGNTISYYQYGDHIIVKFSVLIPFAIYTDIMQFTHYYFLDHNLMFYLYSMCSYKSPYFHYEHCDAPQRINMERLLKVIIYCTYYYCYLQDLMGLEITIIVKMAI